MRISPRYDVRGGVADFWHEFRRPQPYRIPILIASCLMTGTLFFGFVQKGEIALPRAPQVTYISTFAPDRTDEEIIASNEENQVTKEARDRLDEYLLEKRRERYRALGEATGIDVDAMEAQIAEEEAAAARRAVRNMGTSSADKSE